MKALKQLKNKKGQILEYCLIAGVMLVGVTAMTTYVSRAIDSTQTRVEKIGMGY